MTDQAGRIWVYLATSPLLGLTVTILIYEAAGYLFRRTNSFPLLNPVLVSMITIIVLLRAGHVSYERYFAGAQFIHVMLGPATVALAIPLYRNLSRVRRQLPAVFGAVIVGSLTSIAATVFLARAFGATPDVVRALAPKSVTTPIAMSISEKLGGDPSLTAAFVILTGILGAMLTPGLFTLLRIRSWESRGIAVGTAAHGIGTARILAYGSVATAFSTLGMGLNAIATSILLPIVWPFIEGFR